ncbi:MAG: bifunctional adenosylcobinamide kinase/adenosylcobinamide-phosphate guanylyltransferase [Spirochaetia bacterium]|nr:bifunctional adenosylcobinamide kinase/adenosylcobinamide-phosphate guanylyltransferase [Spirochaetia bacterium]
MKKNNIIYIAGGARSGKSGYALTLASSYQNKIYIATAEACDNEMKQRIELHKAQRDKSYLTIEEPYRLGPVLLNIQEQYDVVIIDCLTLWLSNLFVKDEKERAFEIDFFLKSLCSFSKPLIIISNELGMGIVPENKIARQFRDEMGTLNQKTAQKSGEAYFMVSGLPLKIK